MVDTNIWKHLRNGLCMDVRYLPKQVSSYDKFKSDGYVSSYSKSTRFQEMTISSTCSHFSASFSKARRELPLSGKNGNLAGMTMSW